MVTCNPDEELPRFEDSGPSEAAAPDACDPDDEASLLCRGRSSRACGRSFWLWVRSLGLRKCRVCSI